MCVAQHTRLAPAGGLESGKALQDSFLFAYRGRLRRQDRQKEDLRAGFAALHCIFRVIYRTYAAGAQKGGLEGECPPRIFLFRHYERLCRS